MTEKRKVEKLYCEFCSKEKNISQFYNSNSPKYANESFKHKIPYCKSCIRPLVYKGDKVNLVAFKNLLKDKLDIPFYDEVYKKALLSDRETIGKYISLLNTYQPAKDILKSKKTLSYADGEVEDVNIVKEKDIVDFDEEEINDFEITKELIKFWGNGYSKEQYESLQNFYDDFVAGYECDSPAQVLNFKNAAKTQLMADEALANENISAYNQLMKTLSSILGDSNVKPVQATGAEANDQITFGVLIKKYENERPIHEELDDEMKKYIDTYMAGHLAKMEGLNNELVDLYNEAMDEFTIDFEKEQIESDE
ncbi:hypothetical protein [Clostridium sp.]|uniref:hypothetical protein n=1 Tax=Clostridium sp. TaxID=1506 RepID=UPI0026053294|nr:hypothetical protein [Clostridium sp.]